MIRTWLFLKNFFIGSKFRILLFGILIGQGLMYPAVHIYKNTPIEYAIIVPEKNFDRTVPRTYVMREIRNLYNEQTVLMINIAPLWLIHDEYEKRHGESNPYVLGFYDYQEHDIWTIDDTVIFAHELRHVFEGSFHRSLDEIQDKGRFKVFYEDDIYKEIFYGF